MSAPRIPSATVSRPPAAPRPETTSRSGLGAVRVPITAVSGSTTGSYAPYAALSRAPESTSRRALLSASTELPSRANDSRIPGGTAAGIRPTNERACAAAVFEAVRAAERSPPCTLTRRSSITALVNATVASTPSPTSCAADRCWSALSDAHHPTPTTAQMKTSEGTTAMATTRDRREAKRPDLGAAAGMLMRISFSIPERSEPGFSGSEHGEMVAER